MANKKPKPPRGPSGGSNGSTGGADPASASNGSTGSRAPNDDFNTDGPIQGTSSSKPAGPPPPGQPETLKGIVARVEKLEGLIAGGVARSAPAALPTSGAKLDPKAEPVMDPRLGDKDPVWREWLRKNNPKEYAKRFGKK